ncbi:MAG TPA: ELWxxDGT repeat protein, partial [Gemmataceae bacterium]|nr:ELWxxDGT repeat protein [Gemmataceae bacterium]
MKRLLLSLRTLEDRTVPSGTPELVLDINPDTESSGVSNPVTIDSTTFFVMADHFNSEFALWKSDGTAAGTVLLKDFTVAGMNTIPTNLTNVNGTLFFRGYTPEHGSELWKSDGTAAGTVLVKDIRPGTNGTFPNGSGPSNLANVGGRLFFSADDGIHGRELWSSDGTESGTVLVADLTAGGSTPFRSLTAVNDDLFFETGETYGDFALWTSDGSVAGTTLLRAFPQPSQAALWSATIAYPTAVNGTLFFAAIDTWAGGWELWKSDGTAAGTVLVKDIYPAPAGSSYPTYLTEMNGTLYFTAYDGSHGWELWKSTGTAAGTSLVKDINPGSATAYPSHLEEVGGTLYFAANDGTHGTELWKSDGTAAGTSLVKDINPGTPSSRMRELTDVGGTLFLIADDGIHGRDIWTSDGTATGTVLVKDIYDGTLGYFPRQLTDMNGTLFFEANDGTHGFEPWTSDGTAAGTSLVMDINARGIGSNPIPRSGLNDSLFFQVASTLWTSDGSAAGTVPFGPSHIANSEMLDVNGMLYYSAQESTGQTGLWKSDGTVAGTVLVSPLPDYSYARNLTDVNGTLFFTLSDENGEELWKSDGTVTGTVMVKDIYPGNAPGYSGYWGYYGGGPYSSSPSSLTNVNGTLFFTATDATHGTQLWKSDGTEAGTVLFKDFSPGSTNWMESLANVNGTLYISASDGTNGLELWKSDGTVAGTVLVKDIVPGSGGSGPFYLTNVNGTLYFTADDGTHGRELWTSDGTAAGTVLVADVNPGAVGSTPRWLTDVNGTLYFSADNGTHGRELWASEGATTALVGDINAGADTSDPSFLTAVNGTLFFRANDVIHGYELWKVDPDSNAQPGISINDATLTEGNAGTTTAQFTVYLSAPSEEPVTVEYATAGGTAASGTDFQSVSGTLTFAPGEVTQLVTVSVTGDRLAEPAETLFVVLTGPTNAVLIDNRGVGTILDDEPRVSIGDVTVTEGNTGTVEAVFLVTLATPYDQPVTVPYTTASGTATAGTDFLSATSSVIIPAGATS